MANASSWMNIASGWREHAVAGPAISMRIYLRRTAISDFAIALVPPR